MREDEIIIDGKILPKYWKYLCSNGSSNIWKTEEFEFIFGRKYLKVKFIGVRNNIFFTGLIYFNSMDYIDLMNLTNSYYSHYKPMKFDEFI